MDRLDAAYRGKLAIYAPLITALSYYTESGWQVQILPWVVGARGLVQKCHKREALEYLEVPQGKQQSIIDDTVEASIAALAFMSRTWFSALSRPTLQSPNTDPPVFDPRGKHKHKAKDGPGNLEAVMTR